MYLKAKELSMLAAEHGTERNVKIRYLKKKNQLQRKCENSLTRSLVLQHSQCK